MKPILIIFACCAALFGIQKAFSAEEERGSPPYIEWIELATQPTVLCLGPTECFWFDFTDDLWKEAYLAGTPASTDE